MPTLPEAPAPSSSPGALLSAGAAVLPLLATAVWLHAHVAQLPARWPRHWDAAGHPNGWATRSMASLMMPLALGFCVLLIMLGILAFNTYAPGDQPRQRQRLLAPMAALAWCMTLLFCTLSFSPFFWAGNPAFILITMGLHLAGILAIIVWMVVRTGFLSGETMTEPAAHADTSTNPWRAGIFYCDPGNRSVLVPKRFGLGWTLNFARPASWIFLAGIVVLALAGAVIPFAMH